MKVKFVHSYADADHSYKPGDVFVLEKKQAASFVASGLCIPADEAKSKE